MKHFYKPLLLLLTTAVLLLGGCGVPWSCSAGGGQVGD
mgnify:CR=1 FL=1